MAYKNRRSCGTEIDGIWTAEIGAVACKNGCQWDTKQAPLGYRNRRRKNLSIEGLTVKTTSFQNSLKRYLNTKTVAQEERQKNDVSKRRSKG